MGKAVPLPTVVNKQVKIKIAASCSLNVNFMPKFYYMTSTSLKQTKKNELAFTIYDAAIIA
jgi:hypothetical protein